MTWPAAAREARRHDKYERIAAALEAFRSENLPQKAACLPRDVREVLDYVHDHLFDPALNVTTVRAGCRLRDNNISTRFRMILGLGIREHIEHLRMLAADRLLRELDLEIYLVAMAVGYDHQETFCRAFHRHFGDSPSRSRENARENVKKTHQEMASTPSHRSSDI